MICRNEHDAILISKTCIFAAECVRYRTNIENMLAGVEQSEPKSNWEEENIDWI